MSDLLAISECFESLNSSQLDQSSINDLYTDIQIASKRIGFVVESLQVPGTESIGSALRTVMSSLARLVTEVIRLVGNMLRAVFKFIQKQLSAVKGNITQIDSLIKKDPTYLQRVQAITFSPGIDAQTYVEYMHSLIKLVNTTMSWIDPTKVKDVFTTLVKLKSEDTGIYLPPTEYPLTKAKLNDDVITLAKTLGFSITDIGVVTSPDGQEVIEKITVNYTSSFKKDMHEDIHTFSELGYNIANIKNIYNNSYSQLLNLEYQGNSYLTMLNEIKYKLARYSQTIDQQDTSNIIDLNHKFHRIRLLTENVSAYINVFSKFVIISSEYLQWFTVLTSAVRSA